MTAHSVSEYGYDPFEGENLTLVDMLRARACPAGEPWTGDDPSVDHGHTDCWLYHRAAERIEELERERDHWRANHDNQRNLKRKLHDMYGELRKVYHEAVGCPAPSPFGETFEVGDRVTPRIPDLWDPVVETGDVGVVTALLDHYPFHVEVTWSDGHVFEACHEGNLRKVTDE